MAIPTVQEVQRHVQIKESSTLEAGPQGPAKWDLQGAMHAFGIACHLFLYQSPATVEATQCSACANVTSTGPMAECVAEDLESTNWIGGCCTNCYYKGKGAQCSLRWTHLKATMGNEHQKQAEIVQAMLKKIQEETQKRLQSNFVFGPNGVSVRIERETRSDTQNSDKESSGDELPPLLPYTEVATERRTTVSPDAEVEMSEEHDYSLIEEVRTGRQPRLEADWRSDIETHRLAVEASYRQQNAVTGQIADV